MLKTLRWQLAIGAWCWAVLFGTPGHAQPASTERPANGWDVLRIFVPADQISRVATKDYVLMSLDELDAALKREAERRREASSDVPHLHEAIYVARLDRDLIVSELSRWTLAGRTDGQPLNLGDVSFAIQPPRATPATGSALTDTVLLSPGGDIHVEIPQPVSQQWFGFSLSAADVPGEFDFRLPPAVHATMLISTSQLVDLTSPDVVVERVDGSTEFLPPDWPAANVLLGGQVGRQWWRVYLSARRRFRLLAHTRSPTTALRSPRVIQEARLEYQLAPEETVLRAQYRLSPTDVPGPMRFEVDANIRLRSILVDGAAVPWRVQSGDESSSDTALVELELAGQPARAVEITAIAPRTVHGALPTVAMEDAVVLLGSTRIASAAGVVISNVTSDRGLPRTAAVSNAPSESAFRAAVWELEWADQQPTIEVATGRSIERWTAASLTRLTVQPQWLSAHCHLRLQSAGVRCNELQIKVGGGWYVDSVKLVNSAMADLHVRHVPEASESPAGGTIVISWQLSRPVVQLELEVLAHRSHSTRSQVIQLFDGGPQLDATYRLLTIPVADQSDHYAIEPSEGYRLRPTAELMAFQKQIVDLPIWQQQLLPEAGSRWILGGVQQYIPRLELVAQQSKVTVQAFAIPRVDAQAQPAAVGDVHYVLLLDAAAGPLGDIDVLCPSQPAGAQWRWRVSEANELASLYNDRIQVARTGESVRVQLPGVTSSRLELVGVRDVPESDRQPAGVPIEFPRVVGATAQENQVLLAPALALQNAPASAELSDAQEVFDDRRVRTAVQSLAASPVDTHGWVVARIESRSENPLKVVPVSLPDMYLGWVDQQRVERVVESSGEVTHALNWDITLVRPSRFSVTLPAGWRHERAALDGRDVAPQPGRSGRLEFEIGNPGEHRLQIWCRGTSRRWLHSLMALDPELPEISLPVRSTEYRSVVPPQWIPVAEVLAPAGTRLIDRLVPASWWARLLPATRSTQVHPAGPFDRGVAQPLRDPGGWGQPGHGTTVWLVSQSAAAALAMGLTVVLTSLAWMVIGWSPRRGWLLLAAVITALVAVPAQFVAPMQLLALAVGLAAWLRALGFVIVPARRGPRAARRTGPVRGSSMIGAILLVLWCGAGIESLPCRGQEAQVAAPSGDAATADAPQRVYGVLIPIDEDRQVAGSYVYVPQELQDVLDNPTATTQRQVVPRLRAAHYELRSDASVSSPGEMAIQLTAQFRVQMPQAGAELLLPLLRDELVLSQYEVGGPAEASDRVTVRQEASFVLVRAEVPGEYSVRLHFNPKTESDSQGVARLQAQIPVVPTATMRVLQDGAARIKVRSLGRQQRSGSELSIHLGPVDELDCTWYPLPEPTVESDMPHSEVYMWVHAQGDALMAASLLRLRGFNPLDRDLHLSIDSNWEPISGHCGDVELVETGVMPLGNRRVYTVRVREDAAVSSEYPIEILVLLRPAAKAAGNSLPLPYTGVQEAMAPDQITLTWSALNSQWNLVDSNQWTTVPTPASVWRERGFQETGVTYQVPTASSGLFRRQTPGEVGEFNELCKLHIRAHEVRAEYEARWTQPAALQRTARLEIPWQSRVTSVSMDGVMLPYRILTEGDRRLLLVQPDPRAAASMQRIAVELAYPWRLEEPHAIQRPLLLDADPLSSRVQFFRTYGLDLDIEPTADPPLVLSPAGASPTELLSALEIEVGQFELGNDYRSSAALPANLTVRPAQLRGAPNCVLFADRDDLGWYGRLHVDWQSSDTPLDFLFVDIPERLRQSLDVGPLPRRFIPSGNQGRVTLCIVPPPPDDRGRVQLDLRFPLEASATTSELALPSLQVLADGAIDPVYALARLVDGHPLRWDFPSGRAIDAAAEMLPVDGDYQLVRFAGPPPKLRWHTAEGPTPSPQIVLGQYVLEHIQGTQAIGMLELWLKPAGHTELFIASGQDHRVLGIETPQGEPAKTWVVSDAGAPGVRVQLVPNQLPLRLFVYLESRLVAAREPRTWELRFPAIEFGTGEVQPVTHFTSQVDDWSIRTSGPAANAAETRIAAWARVLVDAYPTLMAWSVDQRQWWLQQFSPTQVGVPLDANLPAEFDWGEIPMKFDEDSATVGQAWSQLTTALDTPQLANATGMAGTSPLDQPRGRTVHVMDGAVNSILLAQGLQPPAERAKWVAAALVAFAFVLASFVGRQLQTIYVRSLAKAAWIWWLQLAVLALLLFPTYWPAVGLSVCTLFLAWGYWSDRRRGITYR